MVRFDAAINILHTLRQTDPDDDCTGMVGELLNGENVQTVSEALRAEGYQVSDSRDEHGVRWIWVA